MQMWEAIMLVNKGCKVRKVGWAEGRYLVANGGMLCWHDGEIVYDLIDDGEEWEVYKPELKNVDKFWGDLYIKIIRSANSYQEMLNKCGGVCGDCPFRKACHLYDDMYYELKFLQDEYNINNK